VSGKWLELLKETAPRTNRLAFLFNPTTAPFATYSLDSFKAAARTSLWRRSPHLLAICPSSNPLLSLWHANRMTA
jgi:hypothetical protein